MAALLRFGVLAVAAVAFLAAGCSTAVPPMQHVASTRAGAVHPATCAATVLVPLYTYPGSTWTTVENERHKFPGTPITVIVNPNNGPGTSKDPNYASGIAALQKAGAIVLGYDHTSYGKRTIAAVENDAKLYHQWYAADGIFFDEMANTSGHESYYRTVSAYAKSLGMSHTVGNPGTDTLQSYVGTVDTIVIYESAGYPPLTRFGGWHASYPKSTWGSISYSVASLSITKICALSQVAGFVYVTNAGLPNPYDRLPTYFDSLVKNL